MKKLIVALILINAFLFSPLSAQADPSVFAQLSSNVNQVGVVISAEQVDGLSRMRVEGKAVVVDHQGAYLVVLAPQTGAYAGCSNYWMRVNDEDIANSNIRVCQTNQGDTTVAVAQSVLVLERGDKLTFVTSGVLGIEATQPADEPLVPSVIISVVKF